jgi:hypothetical protein
MSLDHEKQRLYKLVDLFIYTQNNLLEESPEYDSPRITNAMIVCSIDVDEGSDVIENIGIEADSRSFITKLGLLDMAKNLLYKIYE